MSRRIKSYATRIVHRILLHVPDGDEKNNLRAQISSGLARWSEQEISKWYRELERLWDDHDIDTSHASRYRTFCAQTVKISQL